MKKAFVIFALCLVLVLGAAGAAIHSLHTTRDQVTVTAETLAGDPAQAAGLTAKQSAQYNGRLRWDLTIPLDRPEDTATAFSYHQTQIGEPQPSHDLYMYVPIVSALFFHDNSTMEDTVESSPELKSLLPMFQDVASRTPDGERYSETVTLKDYVDRYPLAVDLGGLSYRVLHSGEGSAKAPLRDDVAISQAFQDFFSFPIPENEAWTVTIEKDDQGSLLDLSTECLFPAFSPNVISVLWEDALFFTFDHSAANFENTPGGFGLYRLDLVRERNYVSLDLDSLANVHPLPEEAVVLNLTDSYDGQTLLLTYCLGEDYTCEVLDPETMTVLQSFPVPADPPSPVQVHTEDFQGNEISYEETHWDLNGSLLGENFLVLYGDARFHLFPLENGTYTYALSAPMEEHMRFYPYAFLSGAWNGEKLALASVSEEYEPTTGLSLSIFEDGALVYQGIYKTSLNDAPAGQETPDSSPVHLLSGSELTLTWA